MVGVAESGNCRPPPATLAQRRRGQLGCVGTRKLCQLQIRSAWLPRAGVFGVALALRLYVEFLLI